MEIIKNVLKTMKINHYIKNTIVFVPLIFSKNYYSSKAILLSFFMFIAFSLISSAVYIMNDLIDIEKDRLHPIKKKRPIASGKISKDFAICLLLLFLIISSFIGYKINNLCFVSIIAYFVLNIFYSLYLKYLPIIDAAVIALGFIIRIISGCFAIVIIPSPLVILMTFFVSMFFTSGKRLLEYKLVSYNNQRQSVKECDESILKQFVLINAMLSISFYFTYMMDAETILRTGTRFIYFTTVPFTLLVFRLLYLLNIKNIDDDPMSLIKNDKTIKWLSILYFLVLFTVLGVLK